MTFSPEQRRALKAKLAHARVKTRLSNGKTIAYLEGWYVIAEANRIFGLDNWDRQTLKPKCVWVARKDDHTSCFYTTRVRVSVRAGDTLVIREGIGTGSARAPQPEVAHEIAIKAAETDGTKRALATFGNPFGLALYDKDQVGVTKPKSAVNNECPSFELIASDGATHTFTDLALLLTTVAKHVESMTEVQAIYAFWEQNRRLLMRLSALPETAQASSDMILCLKSRLQALAKEQKPATASPGAGAQNLSAPGQAREATSAYSMPKEKRLRDKAHLDYVRTKPCAICGRTPVHAHHLRFAQRRAMGMKVSDEYTVPLCSIHHDELHRTADEQAWWARHGIIEPLKIAAKLWMQSRGVVTEEDSDSKAVTNGQAAAE